MSCTSDGFETGDKVDVFPVKEIGEKQTCLLRPMVSLKKHNIHRDWRGKKGLTGPAGTNYQRGNQKHVSDISANGRP